MDRQRRFLPLIGFVLACFVRTGCSSDKPVETAVPSAYQNLRKLSSAYLRATQTANRPPRNLEELMPFLEKEGKPSEILRSPDDGQDYVILWGVDFRRLQPTGGVYPVLAYEQRGKKGKRFVLQVRNIVRLTDDELRKAPFPPGAKPPS